MRSDKEQHLKREWSLYDFGVWISSDLTSVFMPTHRRKHEELFHILPLAFENLIGCQRMLAMTIAEPAQIGMARLSSSFSTSSSDIPVTEPTSARLGYTHGKAAANETIDPAEALQGLSSDSCATESLTDVRCDRIAHRDYCD